MAAERKKEIILYAMRQRGLGVSADAICRKLGITKRTLRNWEQRKTEFTATPRTGPAPECCEETGTDQKSASRPLADKQDYSVMED